MSAGTDALKTAFRDYQTRGVPATGANEPDKAEIRAAADQIALDIAAASVGDLGEAVALLQPMVNDAEAAAAAASSSAEEAQGLIGDVAVVRAALPETDAQPELIPLIIAESQVLLWLRAGKLDSVEVSESFARDVVNVISQRVELRERVPLITADDRVILWLEDGVIRGPGLTSLLRADQADLIFEPRQSPAGTTPLATDDRSLTRWRAHKNNVRRGVAGSGLTLAVEGDSWAELYAIPNALRVLADEKYEIAGEGFRSPRWGDRFAEGLYTISGSWIAVDGSATSTFPYGAGPDGHNIWTDAADQTISWTGVLATEIQIFSFQHGGTWRYRVDGGAWTVVNDGTGGGFVATVISSLADGAHDLEIDTTGNTGVVSFAGFHAKRSVPGARILKLGNGGLLGSRMLGFTQYMGAPAEQMQPSLSLTFLGTNDHRSANSPPDVYIAALQSKVDYLRAAVPDLGFLFVIPPRTNGTVVTPLSAYRDALYNWCVQNGHGFYNAHDRWAEFGRSNAYGLFADNSHLNSAGAALLASELNELFLKF